MKNLSSINLFKRSFLTFLFISFQLVCWSQDSTKTTVKTTTTEHREWYSIPWIWVVAGIAVILLIVALASRGRGSSTTTITDTGAGTRTITTDND